MKNEGCSQLFYVRRYSITSKVCLFYLAPCFRYEKAAKLGFKLVEVPLPYSVEPELLKKEAEKYGIKHTLINAAPG